MRNAAEARGIGGAIPVEGTAIMADFQRYQTLAQRKADRDTFRFGMANGIVHPLGEDAVQVQAAFEAQRHATLCEVEADLVLLRFAEPARMRYHLIFKILGEAGLVVQKKDEVAYTFKYKFQSLTQALHVSFPDLRFQA